MMKPMNKIVVWSLGLMLLASLVGCAKLNPNTEGQIQAALQAKAAAFKICYEDALTRDREGKGNVGLRLEIAAESGQVTSAAVSSSDFQDPAMNQCVQTAASGISLDEAPGVPVESNNNVLFSFQEEVRRR